MTINRCAASSFTIQRLRTDVRRIIRIHASCHLLCELLRVRHYEHFSDLCFSVYSVTKHSDRPMKTFETRKLGFWLLFIGNSDFGYCVDVILFRRSTVRPVGSTAWSTATSAGPSGYQVSFGQTGGRRIFTFIRNAIQHSLSQWNIYSTRSSTSNFLVSSSTRSSCITKVHPPG